MSQARANPGHARSMRIAEPGIDSAQRAGYLAAVAKKDDPARVIVVEIYADEAADKAQLESP